MKKVLALVLAVLMISTVAFAATNVPGDKIKIKKTSATNGTATAPATVTITGNNVFDKDVLNANYSVTGIRYNEGKALIKGISISDSDEAVVVELVQDYTNFKDKKVDVEFTVKGKGKYRDSQGVNVSVSDLKVKVVTTVGYQQVKLSLGQEGNNDINLNNIGAYATNAQLEGKLLKFETNSAAAGQTPTVNAAWANLSYNYDSSLDMEVRVYDGNQFYLFMKNGADSAVLKANADSDAEMFFYNFPGTPTFDATAKLYFNDADKDHIVYSIKDGVLTKVGAYSEDDGCWVVKARTLGSYVVSDKELVSASAATTTPANANPDTGANDVVGIATALAAVALVSAAAVSLKK